MNRSSGAVGQAFGALGDQRGGMASSSYSAGRTYDGSTGGGVSSIGPQAGLPSVGNAATPGSQVTQTSTPNPASQKLANTTAPPTPTSSDSTPWKTQMEMAEGLVAVALVLLMFKKQLVKMMDPTTLAARKMIEYAIDAMMGAIGLAIIALGAMVAGGQYGQVLQGHLLAAAGAGVLIAAAASAYSDSGQQVKPGMGANGTMSPGQPLMTADTDGSAADGMTTNANSGLGGVFVLVGGGLALVSTAGAALIPPKTVPNTSFNQGASAPIQFAMGRMPSEDALRRLS
jgi:hypothetical protein